MPGMLVILRTRHAWNGFPWGLRGVFYYETKVLWRSQFTCIDMHKNSKMRHSISLRKFDRVFEISKMRHFKCSTLDFSSKKCLILEFLTFEVSHFRNFEHSIKVSERNRVSHFRIFMHIDARELSPS